MPKFRKKPVVIEAEQFLLPLYKKENEMFMEFSIQHDKDGYFLIIPTLEGNHRANLLDWIITGAKGEIYPCKPDIFEATYDRVFEFTPRPNPLE